MKKIGLALGGGGARGLAHIEFLKVLDELELRPSMISGTSIGAIIGAFYAAGLSANELDEILNDLHLTDREESEQKMERKDISKRILPTSVKQKFKDIKKSYKKLEEWHKLMDVSFFSSSSFLKGKAVSDFFSSNLPVQKFEELEIPLKIIATDYWRRNEVIFQKGDLVPAIRASMSIPAVFEPMIIDDKLLVDGGLVNPVPFDKVCNEVDFMIAIDVSGSKSVPVPPKKSNVFDSVLDSFEIAQSAIVKAQLQNFKPQIYLKPELCDVAILDFHKGKEIIDSVQNLKEHFKKELISKLKL